MQKQATGEGFIKVTKMETPEDFRKTDIAFLDDRDKRELVTYLEKGSLWTTSDASWAEEEPQKVIGTPKTIRVVSVVHGRVFVENHTAVENNEGVWVDDIAFC